MSAFLLSAFANVAGSLLGRADEARQARENTDRANAEARAAATLAFRRNQRASAKANRWNVKQAALAERRSDDNATTARRFNADQAAKANRFTKDQADLAYQRSERRDLRNRQWAKDDYQQQKADYGSQFERLRSAAEKAGFNPLSVLGSQMTPLSAAGGLSSSSYGAGVGVGASTGFASSVGPTASVPMAYASDVAVAPIASNAAVVGAVGELGAEVTGANAVQRQTDELYRDLAQIQLDELRSGVRATAGGPAFPSAPAGAVPQLGRNAWPVGGVSVTPDVAGERWPSRIELAYDAGGVEVVDPLVTPRASTDVMVRPDGSAFPQIGDDPDSGVWIQMNDWADQIADTYRGYVGAPLYNWLNPAVPLNHPEVFETPRAAPPLWMRLMQRW